MWKKTNLAAWCVGGILLIRSYGVSAADIAQGPSFTAVEVIHRMLESDKARRSALQEYTSDRRYVADNKRFSKHAEMAVREKYVYPGKKQFETISENGSDYIRRKVISKLIEAEQDAAQNENRDQTRITPENYKFELLGSEEQEGRPCFLIALTPNQSKKYLMKGRIWVDHNDFAIVRMEGRPAKNPSFWTRKVEFTRRYHKHGPFWLAASIESESELLIAGKSSLKIEYSNYVINQAKGDQKMTSLAKGVSQ